MKKIIFLLFTFIISINTAWGKENPMLMTINPEYSYLNHPEPDDYINRLTVYKKEASIGFSSDIRIDHRIFGFSKPSFDSQIIFLLSVWTPDVKGNPFHAKLGAYYDFPGEITYLGIEGSFIKASLEVNGESHILYFDKAWAEFE